MESYFIWISYDQVHGPLAQQLSDGVQYAFRKILLVLKASLKQSLGETQFFVNIALCSCSPDDKVAPCKP